MWLSTFPGQQKGIYKKQSPWDDDSSGANNKLIKKQTNKKTQKGKLENDISIGGFEKLCYIPVNLEGHIHA